jgi:hypothetical protein
MAPTWLTVVAWIYLAICFGCTAVIACDIFVNGRRLSMGVMNVVFPITALYFGPLAVAFYPRWGRAAADMTTAPMAMSHASLPQTEVTPAELGRVLAAHAGRHDCRVRDVMAGKRLAG